MVPHNMHTASCMLRDVCADSCQAAFAHAELKPMTAVQQDGLDACMKCIALVTFV